MSLPAHSDAQRLLVADGLEKACHTTEVSLVNFPKSNLETAITESDSFRKSVIQFEATKIRRCNCGLY
jgi:hypothetical protein